jgi:signal transduction histidine kinase
LAIVIVLGVAGGFFVTRRVLKRVDAMTETTRKIMDGDLAGRLPVAGTGDELDRLATNLNAMLERIEALMHGLKEVSDNIAHDLKTPLTRLRNRCEEALRLAEDESQYRAALESTIEESEALIRTFNALLMIARAESGQARDGMIDFDAAEIARGVGELYEPTRGRQGHPSQGRSAGSHAGSRQPRADQPGARQSGRQRHQIRRGDERRRGRDCGDAQGRGRSHPAHVADSGAAFRRPIGAARSSVLCGSSRAARSRAPGWG